jgi:cell division topological specificity factor MinE
MKENNIINNVVSYNSGRYAKERLKNILMADRIGCTPDVITHIKDDISKIVSNYVDIDTGNLTVQLSDSLLLARIPVLGIHMKREKEKHETDKNNESNG